MFVKKLSSQEGFLVGCEGALPSRVLMDEKAF
jgi:hypothetical protein